MPRLVGSRDDAGIVSTVREHEGRVGVRDEMNFEGRLPGSHMIAKRADDEHRRMQIG